MTNKQIHIGDMSHETAIGILKLMLEAMEVYDSISTMPERVNAVKMGIEALEQEPNCSEIPTSSTTKNDLGVDKTFYEQIVEYCNEHFLVLVEKDVWEDARKALTTKNDLGVDCIKKSDAIDIIQDMHGLARADVISDAVNRVITMPLVIPIRPKGHWIDTNDEGFEYHRIYKCSNCECTVCAYPEEIKRYKFCYGCGSRNEVGE